MHRTRLAFALLSVSLVSGCATASDDNLYFRSDPSYVVTYYDRNGDGTADFAFYHIPDSDDMDWALVDTHFSGRFDLKIHYGIAVGEYHLARPIPVPSHVRLHGPRLPVIYP
jgi:hypothetical protein